MKKKQSKIFYVNATLLQIVFLRMLRTCVNCVMSSTHVRYAYEVYKFSLKRPTIAGNTVRCIKGRNIVNSLVQILQNLWRTCEILFT